MLNTELAFLLDGRPVLRAHRNPGFAHSCCHMFQGATPVKPKPQHQVGAPPHLKVVSFQSFIDSSIAHLQASPNRTVDRRNERPLPPPNTQYIMDSNSVKQAIIKQILLESNTNNARQLIEVCF